MSTNHVFVCAFRKCIKPITIVITEKLENYHDGGSYVFVFLYSLNKREEITIEFVHQIYLAM